MNIQQVNNLINITFLFITNGLNELDPIYIKEKWDKMIGVEFEKSNNHKTSESICWKDRWGLSDCEYSEVEKIILFIISLNSFNFSDNLSTNYINFDKVVDKYESKFGSANNINKVQYNHIHPCLSGLINRFKDLNKREINLIQIIH